jgi:cyclic di-GMP phosphodiesterase
MTDLQEHLLESSTETDAGNPKGVRSEPERSGFPDTRTPPHTILVVDDDPILCKLFDRMLSSSQYTVWTALTGRDALEKVRHHKGQVDVALVDLNLGDENGLDVLKDLRDIEESIIGVVITGDATFDNAVGALQMGAYDFIQKPVVRGSLIAVLDRAIKYRRLVLENKHYQIHLEEMVKEKHAALLQALEEVKATSQFTLEAMAAMLDAREHQTGEHSKRVVQMSLVLAREMRVSPEEEQAIKVGALLHDIGKISTPDSILMKPGPLTAEEFAVMQTHAQTGHDIIKSSPPLRPAAEIVISHHEHFDGNGYPRGLKGDEICLGARIFSVIDTYDAICAERPYSSGKSPEEACEEIVRHRGTQFDPAVVDALLRCRSEMESITVAPLG